MLVTDCAHALQAARFGSLCCSQRPERRVAVENDIIHVGLLYGDGRRYCTGEPACCRPPPLKHIGAAPGGGLSTLTQASAIVVSLFSALCIPYPLNNAKIGGARR